MANQSFYSAFEWIKKAVVSQYRYFGNGGVFFGRPVFRYQKPIVRLKAIFEQQRSKHHTHKSRPAGIAISIVHVRRMEIFQLGVFK